MLNRKNIPNLEELISQLGRTLVRIFRIDVPGIGRGDFIDQEETSVVRNGVAETQTVTHKRLLDCGHLCTISSIVAACDICSSLSCVECIAQCEICGFNVCRYCRRQTTDSDGQERMLCNICRSKENRKRIVSSASRAITGFFVRREGE